MMSRCLVWLARWLKRLSLEECRNVGRPPRGRALAARQYRGRLRAYGWCRAQCMNESGDGLKIRLVTRRGREGDFPSPGGWETTEAFKMVFPGRETLF